MESRRMGRGAQRRRRLSHFSRSRDRRLVHRRDCGLTFCYHPIIPSPHHHFPRVYRTPHRLRLKLSAGRVAARDARRSRRGARLSRDRAARSRRRLRRATLPQRFVSLAATKTFCAPLAALVCLLIRIVLAQNLQRRFTPERHLVSPAWLVPMKDFLQAALWFCAFAGNTLEWRGRKMKLRRDGTLIEEK